MRFNDVLEGTLFHQITAAITSILYDRCVLFDC